jgi:hypothetical protein
MSKIEDLHKAVMVVAPLVLTPEHAHMKKVWEMVVGGLILPEMVKEDPTVLEADRSFKKLLDDHSKKKIEEFLHPKPVELTKEVKVEVPVTREKIVKIPEIHEKIVRISGGPANNGGKYRRLKEKVSKVSRYERELTCSDRDKIISRWNKEQRLVPKDDAICAQIVKEINAFSGLEPLAALQVAGYFSYLCRLGRCTVAIREARIDRAVKRGDLTVRPQYSEELIKKIIENWKVQRADKIARQKDHTELRKRRAAGDRTPLKVIIPEEDPPQGPARQNPPEDFDIGDINFD